MRTHWNFKLIWGLLFVPLSLYAEEDPCRGSDMLFNLVNRPSFSDSACTVPAKKLLIEGGLQIEKLIEEGTQINAPELNVRIGLTNQAELIVNPPNYIHQTVVPFSGATPTWMGIKYRMHSSEQWIIAGEGFVSPPSGTSNFGSPNWEGSVTAIIFNKVTNQLSWQLQVGGSTFSDPKIQGGHQFQSVNPDFLVSYTVQKISAYLEFFGQTKTSSNQGFGLIVGGGIIYLLNSKTTLDAAFYQRMKGELQGFERFVGIGMTRFF